MSAPPLSFEALLAAVHRPRGPRAYLLRLVVEECPSCGHSVEWVEGFLQEEAPGHWRPAHRLVPGVPRTVERRREVLRLCPACLRRAFEDPPCHDPAEPSAS